MTQKNVFWKFLGLLENRLMIYIVSIIMMTTFYAVFEVTGSLFVKSIFDIAEKVCKKHRSCGYNGLIIDHKR